MQPRRDGKDQVAAIELSAGQQIQRGCQHSGPTGQRHRMQIVVRERRSAVVQHSVAELKDQRKAELQVGV